MKMDGGRVMETTARQPPEESETKEGGGALRSCNALSDRPLSTSTPGKTWPHPTVGLALLNGVSVR